MAQIAFPPIDGDIIRRRNSILEGLAKILPPECLIADESGASPLRPTP